VGPFDETTEAYVDANGTPLPDDAFENEVEPRNLPLDPAGRKKFEEETEALMQHKRTDEGDEDEDYPDEDEDGR
jgi:hypothetical protein